MVGALLVSGVAQAFVERAIGGSTHDVFIAGQSSLWFVEVMITRFIFGLMFAVGYVALVWDLLTIDTGISVILLSVLLSLWARRTEFMSWHSWTNTVLAAIGLLLVAAGCCWLLYAGRLKWTHRRHFG